MKVNIFRNDRNLIIKALSIIVITLIVYYKELYLIANEALSNSAASHILAVPFFIGYIIYKKGNTIRAFQRISNSNDNNSKIYDNEILGTIMLTLSILLSWYGSFTFNTIELKMLSLPIFLAGTILIIFNNNTLKILLFPLLFLAFLIPLPVTTIQLIGSRLSVFSSEAAYALLNIFQIPVELSYDLGSPIIILTLQSGLKHSFAIDIGCSGLYSFIGFTLFAIFVSYIIKGSLYKKILTIVIGYPLIYSLNILRIIIIVLIGYMFNTEMAIKIFHLFGGWILIFIGTIILFYISDRIFQNEIITLPNSTCLHNNLNKTIEYCIDCGKFIHADKKPISYGDITKISSLILFSICLLLIQVPVFTLLGGGGDILLKTSGGDTASLEILPEINDYELFFYYRDIIFENISGQDASIMYLYSHENNTKPDIWVGLEIGQTKGCLHPWEVCLITWPQKQGWEPKATKIKLENLLLVEDPPISAKYFSYIDNRENETNSIIYWYTRSIFQTETGYEGKWVKISVIIIRSFDPEEHQSYEQDLLPVAINILNHWEPINTWSSFTLGIAKNGPLLIIFTIIISGSYLSYIQIINMRRENKIKLISSKISSFSDLHILEAISRVEDRIATISKIATNYNQISKYTINLNILEQKLLKAEEIGLTSKSIIQIDNDPYITWISNY